MENDLISRSALKKDLLERSFYPAIVKNALEKAPAAAKNPCDLCRFSPPSSMDGKPCAMCVAERRSDDD